ncbi:MAG: zeta toxin family protein, partial [Pseudomonadota bacterium]
MGQAALPNAALTIGPVNGGCLGLNQRSLGVSVSLRPTLFIFAGPTGSGKTGLRARLEKDGISFDRHIDAGDISQSIDDSPLTAVARAGIVAQELRRRCLKLGADFSIETDLSEEDDLTLMREAKDKGFELALYFVALSDPSLNRARLTERAEATGTPVPTARIYTSYWRIMDHLSDAALIVDRTYVFDNSDETDPHRLTAKCEDDTITLFA